MGVKKKHVPGNTCCGCNCTYEASDGNHYTDSFGSLDAGWIPITAILTASGTMLMKNTVGSVNPHWGLRTVALSPTSLKIIIESLVYSRAYSLSNGLYVSGDDGATPLGFQLLAVWGTGWTCIYPLGNGTVVGSVSVSGTPADGDKLSMSIEEDAISAGRYNVCYSVNNTVIAAVCDVPIPISWSPLYGPFLDSFGLIANNSGDHSVAREIGEWDDFTIHIGNP